MQYTANERDSGSDSAASCGIDFKPISVQPGGSSHSDLGVVRRGLGAADTASSSATCLGRMTASERRNMLPIPNRRLGQGSCSPALDLDRVPHDWSVSHLFSNMSKTAHPGVGETTPQTNPPAQIHHPRRGSALIRFRWPRAISSFRLVQGRGTQVCTQVCSMVEASHIVARVWEIRCVRQVTDGASWIRRHADQVTLSHRRAGCFWTAAQPAVRVLSKSSNRAHRHEQGATSGESSYRGGRFIPIWDGYRR
ncbi:uncharacterized protein BDZ83DRAFT_12160 [Colletotrichum acutatum]|uniref:Uncharacterized protein n=1 Tax=Glomerella acutata TaxID=27357 RepID=A0AAD8XLH7_GLOAC|nr:uncharacterized protein BDZ83DRAFT_12160 [Colletotrichum acutatum]KAK1729605.1 hypothetical protein BDZ83DRAFT_12160 [Colletotrichum acutatum]